MDKYVKYPSNQQGDITATNNLVTFDIPAGGSYNLEDSFLELRMRPNIYSAADTVATGVYSATLGWKGGDGQPSNNFFPNVALVKNCSFTSSAKGEIENIRAVDVLRTNLQSVQKSRFEREGDNYLNASNLMNPLYRTKDGIFADLQQTGTVSSTQLQDVPVQIRLGDLMESCNAKVFNTNRAGRCRIQCEINADKIALFQQLDSFEDQLNDGDMGAADNVAAGTNQPSSLVMTHPYLKGLEASPYFVGQNVSLIATRPAQTVFSHYLTSVNPITAVAVNGDDLNVTFTDDVTGDVELWDVVDLVGIQNVDQPGANSAPNNLAIVTATNVGGDDKVITLGQLGVGVDLGTPTYYQSMAATLFSTDVSATGGAMTAVAAAGANIVFTFTNDPNDPNEVVAVDDFVLVTGVVVDGYGQLNQPNGQGRVTAVDGGAKTVTVNIASATVDFNNPDFTNARMVKVNFPDGNVDNTPVEITSITLAEDTGKLTLGFDDPINGTAKDATTVFGVNVDPLNWHTSTDVTIIGANLVLKQLAGQDPNAKSVLRYNTYSTQQSSYGGVTNFQQQYIIEPESTNVLAMFPRNGTANNDTAIISNNNDISSYRLRLDNMDLTDRDVDVNILSYGGRAVHSPLYYDRLSMTLDNMGSQVNGLEGNIGSAGEQIDYSDVYKYEAYNVVMAANPVPQSDRPKNLQVNIDATNTTIEANAGGVKDLYLYKVLPRELEI